MSEFGGFCGKDRGRGKKKRAFAAKNMIVLGEFAVLKMLMGLLRKLPDPW